MKPRINLVQISRADHVSSVSTHAFAGSMLLQAAEQFERTSWEQSRDLNTTVSFEEAKPIFLGIYYVPVKPWSITELLGRRDCIAQTLLPVHLHTRPVRDPLPHPHPRSAAPPC